jgi:cation transport regulator ChaC
VVRQSKGNSGANPDYVASAVEQLQVMGINDRALANINRLVAEGS